MRERLGSVVAALCVVAVAVTVLVLGVANPPTPTPVSTDRLGPDSGEPVSDYLARAADTLAGPDDGLRWGLVAFDSEVTAVQADVLTGDVRVSQLWFRVPIDRVQTPIVPVGVSGAESIARAPGLASAQLRGTTGEWDRQAQVDAVSSLRLAQGCACVVAATVRAPVADLAALAGVDGVRAVEALPADAVFGRFAVRPLLPEQTDRVLPGPDDGEVPAR